MKKIIFILLMTMPGCMQLYAMGDVNIVPFDCNIHGEKAAKLFLNEFDWNNTPPDALTRTTNNQKEAVYVATRSYRQTRSKRPDSLLGFVIYETKKLTIESPDLPEYYPHASIKTLNGTKIEWLAVDSRQRQKGCGRLLLRHAENKAAKKKSDFTYLNAISDAVDFYKKVGYEKPRISNPNWHFMIKPLTNKGSDLVSAIDTYGSTHNETESEQE